jgi:hypothetical protein
MALIVEDGTGRDDAESYVSVVDLKAYADARGLGYGSATDTALEQKLREATTYIDARYRYKGSRTSPEQSLEFPRASLVDWSGLTVTGVPRRVKHAACELALKALVEPLYADLDRGGKVVSESVGSLSTTYADDAPVGKVWTVADNLLKPYTRDNTLRGFPQYGGSTEADGGYFSLGMNDSPLVGSPLNE